MTDQARIDAMVLNYFLVKKFVNKVTAYAMKVLSEKQQIIIDRHLKSLFG